MVDPNKKAAEVEVITSKVLGCYHDLINRYRISV